MNWQWVALILGLVFNFTILWIAMSPGWQYRMANGKVVDLEGREGSNKFGRDYPETQETLSQHDTTRSI